MGWPTRDSHINNLCPPNNINQDKKSMVYRFLIIHIHFIVENNVSRDPIGLFTNNITSRENNEIWYKYLIFACCL